MRNLIGVILVIALITPLDAAGWQLAGRQALPQPPASMLPTCTNSPVQRRLRLGLPSDRPPLSSGTVWRPEGLVAAYVRRMPAGTLELIMLPTAQLRQRMLAGRLDAVIGLPLADLAAGWTASPPFLELPLLIATRRDSAPVLGLADLRGRRVAVLDTLPAALDTHGLDLLLPGNVSVALAQLRKGVVDAVIGNAMLLEAERRRWHDDGLVVGATLPAHDQLVLAVAPGCDAWTTVFEQVLQAVPVATQHALRQSLSTPSQRLLPRLGEPSSWLIGGIALLLLTCVQGLGIVRLRREGRRRKQLARRLQEVSDNLPAVVFQVEVTSLRAIEMIFVAGDVPQLFTLAGDALRERPQRLLDTLLPRHRMRVLMALVRAAKTRQPLALEFPAEGVRGLRWLAMHAWPLAGGVQWSGYWVDITGQQLDQLALARAHAQAQADLGARGQLLVALDDGVREPMKVLRGALAGLNHVPLANAQQTALAVLGDATAMLDALLHEVLGDGQGVDLEPSERVSHPVDLRALLESVRQLLAPVAAAKGLWFRGSADAALAPCLMADGVGLRQVLFNLLGNALKFTAQGGVALSVEVDAAASDDQCQHLCISVQDTGVGIPPERQQAVFEPYAQADVSTARRYGGAGLGLAISRRLVQRMGGRLRLHSQPGQGSRVDIEITLRCCRVGEQLPISVPSSNEDGGSVASNPLRVLVAEDHPTQQLLLDNWLREMGVAPDAATDGLQAIHACRLRRYALLLTDVQMPVMGGLELAASIRKEERSNGWPRMPIIGLSADEAGLNAAEFDLVLRKPIARDALHAALQQLLGRALPPLRPRALASGTAPVPAPATPSELPTIDDLTRRFGSAANAHQLVESLSISLDSDLLRLHRARTGGDEEAVRQQLHRIAGGIGSVGIRALAEELRALSELPSPLPDSALEALQKRLQCCKQQLVQMMDAAG